MLLSISTLQEKAVDICCVLSNTGYTYLHTTHWILYAVILMFHSGSIQAAILALRTRKRKAVPVQGRANAVPVHGRANAVPVQGRANRIRRKINNLVTMRFAKCRHL